MASVLRENIGLLNDKLTVQLTKDDYMPSFEQAIKKYAKSATIPGFRKGMVPAGMIKKMHGVNVFTDEVLRTVEKELNNYMQIEQLNIFAQPLPMELDSRQLDMNNPADYSFAFEIGLKPAINIDLPSIQVTRFAVDVTEEMINEEVERLSVRHGNMTEPEAVESDDNVLNVEFIEIDKEGNIVENGIHKGNSLLVKYFSESIRPQLIGKKKDDSITINLNEAFEEKEREWIISDLGLSKDDETAGDKIFKLNITKVGLVTKPEMDSNFFDAAFPGKNLTAEADFRNAVKESLQQQWASQTRSQLHDQIYHQLVDGTQFEFPESFLKRWMQVGNEEKKTAEEAEVEYPNFKNSLKWTLISSQLMDENQIKVENAEIKEFARRQIMGYMGIQSLDDAPWLDSYAENMLKDKKFIENTYYQIQTTKLFSAIEHKVSVTEQLVTPEELNAKKHNHSH
ncbi:MAG: trigger factor [Chitinophagaceae bacterium]|nr:trigger factor [Chitinophagaceae bacterium]